MYRTLNKNTEEDYRPARIFLISNNSTIRVLALKHHKSFDRLARQDNEKNNEIYI